jgi:hypothetical protein
MFVANLSSSETWIWIRIRIHKKGWIQIPDPDEYETETLVYTVSLLPAKKLISVLRNRIPPEEIEFCTKKMNFVLKI